MLMLSLSEWIEGRSVAIRLVVYRLEVRSKCRGHKKSIRHQRETSRIGRQNNQYCMYLHLRNAHCVCTASVSRAKKHRRSKGSKPRRSLLQERLLVQVPGPVRLGIIICIVDNCIYSSGARDARCATYAMTNYYELRNDWSRIRNFICEGTSRLEELIKTFRRYVCVSFCVRVGSTRLKVPY